MSIRLHLAALSACVALVACASDAASPPPAAASTPVAATPAAAPPMAATWQLSLTVSGGFAGFDQTFTTAGGSNTLLAQDRRRRSEATVALGSAEQQELARLVAAVEATPGGNQRSSSCRDCFQFELTITSPAAGKSRLGIYDSTTLDGSPDAPLIERVIAIGRAGLNQKQNE